MTDPKSAPSRRPRLGGFTLIEVVAAIFLTSIVLAVAIGFFVTLSRSTEAATNRTREGRYALAALDRLARDLEGAYLLVSPVGEDPFYHAWQFLAESQLDPDGADRVKFVSRNHRPRNPRDHGSDLAVVTYLLREGEEEPGYELVRAVEPGLPQAFDRDFRAADDELFMVVAEQIDRFSMRFLNAESEGQEWQPSWDSAALVEAGSLPAAVEIQLSYLDPYEDASDPDPDDFDESFGDEAPEGSYLRHVVLPMRAIDLESMLEEADAANKDGQDEDKDQDGSEDDEDAEAGEDGEVRTVGDCLKPGDQEEAVDMFGDILNTKLTDDLAQTLERSGFSCQ